ncbi:MAG TPA: cellulase family glycosylhydrolase [Gaiellaceae bacterium]|nr:cellulase family glycosylhydrolase [Gaiellaceae bacterium]
MRRLVRPVAVLAALATGAALAANAAAPGARAAERMWVGFHDDPSFRWSPNRERLIESSARQGSTLMRLLVQWNRTAPRRPAQPANPFDPAYVFDDLDEAIRMAQLNDMEVMLTISGTPSWANGGRAPNIMPQRLSDLTAFARAIASRYSGRYSGYPFVRFWSVWNEPNLQLFLAPQFDERGRSVAPRNYARLYAAAYAGIKAGNPRALVGIGETSARGTDRPTGLRPTHSPGRFAELVAKANPRLRFDAWAHHPYPSTPNLRPSQKVRWPNVSLASLPTFELNLRRWFKRKRVAIWVTEYGHQTKPPDALGVSYPKQAAYIRQAISLARSYPFVDMFVWFVYQDDQGQPWESGLYTQGGAPKGSSPRAFASAAWPLDARNAVHVLRRGTLTPLLPLYARRYCVTDPPGTPIGMTWRILQRGRLIAVGQQSSPLRSDCTVTVRLRFPGAGVAAGGEYTATVEMNDINGVVLLRRLTIRGT